MAYNNNELAHAWAHQTTASGKNGGGSFYFEGETIYSYGSHFPIAVIQKNGVVLFTTNSYSMTTAQHISYARRAAFGQIFNVVDVKATTKKEHSINVNGYKEQLSEAVGGYCKARKKDPHSLLIGRIIEEANSYIRTFKLLNKPLSLDGLDLATIETEARAARKKEILEEKKKQAASLKKHTKTIKQWLAGEPVRFPSDIKKCYMRIAGSKIMTSQGVNFPLEHAIRAFSLVASCVKNKRALVPTSARLGHYHIDKIEKNGTVRAGCHTVEYDQIERCAKELGLIC